MAGRAGDLERQDPGKPPCWPREERVAPALLGPALCLPARLLFKRLPPSFSSLSLLDFAVSPRSPLPCLPYLPGSVPSSWPSQVPWPLCIVLACGE